MAKRLDDYKKLREMAKADLAYAVQEFYKDMGLNYRKLAYILELEEKQLRRYKDGTSEPKKETIERMIEYAIKEAERLNNGGKTL